MIDAQTSIYFLRNRRIWYNRDMKYEKTKELKGKDFRRLTGIKRKTFEKMVGILRKAEAARGRKGGHKSKLPIEEMLLLSLEYWREYRTYFHIAQDFGVHETTGIRISRWVEDVLIKDGTIRLPRKKALVGDKVEYEVIQIHVEESPIERAKKQSPQQKTNKEPQKHAKKILLGEEKASYDENAGNCRQVKPQSHMYVLLCGKTP
jgi:hypothetical protein